MTFLCLVVLGLHYRAGFFLVVLLASHCSGFSWCGAQAVGHVGSGVVASRLRRTGSVFVHTGYLPCSMWG